MANFMDKMYAENSPATKAKKEEQLKNNQINSAAASVVNEIKTIIRLDWDSHSIEGYLTYYNFDGDNYGVTKELKKIVSNNSISRKEYTYSNYLKFKTSEEADRFMAALKARLTEEGITRTSISKQAITVESWNPSSFMKMKTKEYDAYVFHIRITW